MNQGIVNDELPSTRSITACNSWPSDDSRWYPLEWNQDESGDLYRWAAETEQMWDERIQPLVDVGIGDFFRCHKRSTHLEPFSSSIFVFFPEDVPVSGHCAKVRKVWSNMPLLNYELMRHRVSQNTVKSYFRIGAGFIHSKHVLRKMAEESPVFRPIWESLKHISPNDCGIYLAEAPHSDLLAALQGDEEALWAKYRDTKNVDTMGLDLRNPHGWEADVLERAKRLDMAGDLDRACGILRPMIESVSAYWAFWEPLVECQRRSGDAEGAYEVVCEGQRRYPECRLFDRLGFKCCMDMEHYEQAERHVKQLWALNPWGAVEMHYYAEVLCKLHKYARAVRMYQDCAEHRGLTQAAEVRLGVALERSGQKQEAIKLYRRQVDAGNPHILTLNNIAMLLAAAGQLKEACDFCFQALKKDDALGCVWDTMGFVWFKMAQYNKAERCFHKTIGLEPMFPEAWRHLLHVYYRSGQLEKLEKTRARVAYYLPEQVARYEREKDSDITD